MNARSIESYQKHIAVLQAENNEQWDEILQLRNDAKQHEMIVKIYLDKITRLKNEIEKVASELPKDAT